MGRRPTPVADSQSGAHCVNIPGLFIARPIATTLLTMGLALAGIEVASSRIWMNGATELDVTDNANRTIKYKRK